MCQHPSIHLLTREFLFLSTWHYQHTDRHTTQRERPTICARRQTEATRIIMNGSKCQLIAFSVRSEDPGCYMFTYRIALYEEVDGLGNPDDRLFQKLNAE